MKVLAPIVALAMVPALAAAQDRQANRQQAAAAMRAVKGIADSGAAPSGALRHAAKLKELQVAFAAMFPADRDFKALNDAASATYDKLAIAAGSGDRSALTAAWAESARACAACHDKYRRK